MIARSLRVRVLAGSALWIALSLGLGGYVIVETFQRAALNQFDEQLSEELTLLSVGIASTPEAPGDVMVSPSFQRVYSGYYWQAIAADGAAFKSRSLWDFQLADAVADGGRFLDGPDGQALRVLARVLTAPDGRVWTVQVGADTARLDGLAGQFRKGLFQALAAMTVALILAAMLLLRTALGPLNQLRRRVQTMQDGDRIRDVGAFPQEVAPLVHDLNAMFAKNDALRAHGRDQAAKLAHALKTPAAILQNELGRDAGGRDFDRALARDAVQRITDVAQQHASNVGLGQAALRPGEAHDGTAELTQVVRAIRRLYPQLTIAAQMPPHLTLAVSPADQQEIFGNLIDNACKWARQNVKVALTSEAGMAVFTVDDDGPGIPPEKLETVIGHGVRLDQSVPGSGLGLSIVREIATQYGGRLQMSRSDLGGARGVVTLPLGMPV